MLQTRCTAGRLVTLTSTLAAVLVLASAAQAQAPRRGDIQHVQVITIAMQVGSTDKETRHVTYTPPPGWYVRSHSVQCRARYGNSSYTVATVPQDWGWVSEDKIVESYNMLMELAARANDVGLLTKFRNERDGMLSELHHVRSTHHALVVDATARGEGFLRGGGAIQLTVRAELVYIGMNEDIERTVSAHKARLK